MTEEFLNAFRSKYGPGTTSRNWKHWVTQIDLKTCKPCNKMNGKIYAVAETPSPRPPLHPFCRCKIKPMQALVAGYASQEGTDGADYWLKTYCRLVYSNDGLIFTSYDHYKTFVEIV